MNSTVNMTSKAKETTMLNVRPVDRKLSSRIPDINSRPRRSILRQRLKHAPSRLHDYSRHVLSRNAGRRPSRCISHLSSQPRLPCIHLDPTGIQAPTRIRSTGHRQLIRFSTCRTELLNRVRQVP